MISNYRVLFFLCIFSVLIGTTIVVFHQTKNIAPLHSDNAVTFLSATDGFTKYKTFKTAWRSRILSNYTAALFFKTFVPPSIDLENGNHPAFGFVVGLWSLIWFAMTCLLFVYWKPDKAIYYILGTLSAICFGYTPGLEFRVYPWDLPALFFFSAAIIQMTKQKHISLIILIIIATCFKETIGIFCLSFLLIEDSLKQKLKLTFVSILALSATKIIIDIMVASPIPFLTMEYSINADSLKINYLTLNILNTFHSLTPLFVNSGTLLALLLLPVKSHELLRLKFLATLFIIGNYIFGIVTEYRIWFEMIPISLYGFEIAFREYTASKHGEISNCHKA